MGGVDGREWTLGVGTGPVIVGDLDPMRVVSDIWRGLESTSLHEK